MFGMVCLESEIPVLFFDVEVGHREFLYATTLNGCFYFVDSGIAD